VTIKFEDWILRIPLGKGKGIGFYVDLVFGFSLVFEDKFRPDELPITKHRILWYWGQLRGRKKFEAMEAIK
jgi:hypothetical protein